jgi:hypothetical protein
MQTFTFNVLDYFWQFRFLRWDILQRLCLVNERVSLETQYLDLRSANFTGRLLSFHMDLWILSTMESYGRVTVACSSSQLMRGHEQDYSSKFGLSLKTYVGKDQETNFRILVNINASFDIGISISLISVEFVILTPHIKLT